MHYYSASKIKRSSQLIQLVGSILKVIKYSIITAGKYYNTYINVIYGDMTPKVSCFQFQIYFLLVINSYKMIFISFRKSFKSALVNYNKCII